jgi:hypothetical protein
MSAEDMPMEVEDRLACPCADVDEDAVVGEARVAGGFRDEVEHPLRLVGRELRDVDEALDVPLRENEQMGLGLRADVPDRDEAVRLRDVVALANETAEEAILRQRGFPPR